MFDEDTIAIIVVFVVLCLAACGVYAIIGDFRHFDSIEVQCQDRGYIQSKKTRIYCNIETNTKETK